MRRPALLLTLCLASTRCSPPVYPTADRSQQRRSSHIEGNVVVQSTARGNVIVTLHKAPVGTEPLGPAIPFAVVSADELFGSALHDGTSNGPFTAPFDLSFVLPDVYVLRGFLDRDECLTAPSATCRPSDFIPWFRATNEPNRGDVGGLAPGTITLANDADGFPQPVRGVQVGLSDVASFAVDRPAFSVAGNNVFNPAAGDAALTLTLEPLQAPPVFESQPAFLVRWADADGNGIPDDADHDGQPDLWPKLLVRKLSAAPGGQLADENDLDRDGFLDATGVDYLHADGTLDGRPDEVVLAAGWTPPAPVLAALTGPGGPRMDVVVPVTTLAVTLKPIAIDVSVPASPAPLASVPKGSYSIIVLNFSGQSWRVPNELSPGIGLVLGFPEITGQGYAVSIP